MPLDASRILSDFAPGLERAEPLPPTPVVPAPTPEKKGRGRPRTKESEAPAPPARKDPGPPAEEKKGIPWFREKPTLSEKEADALYEPLKAALSDYFDYADEFLWYKEQHTNDTPVWGDADDDELSALARVCIKRGKKSPAAATMVRGMVNGDDYITAAIFIVPRFVESQKRLRAAPRREKPEKRGRR